MKIKLFFSTIGIILLTLIISMVSVNLVFKNQFTNYISQSNEAALDQLSSRLSALYSRNGWDNSALQELANSLPMNTYVTIRDTAGNLIANLSNSMGNMNHGRGMMNNMMSNNMMGTDSTAQEWKTKEIQINGPQGLIAVAQIRYPSSTGTLNPQDASFSSAVFHSLILAGLLSLILGVLLSLLMSRRLAAPLQALTKAANRIGAGNLDERVPNTGTDEIGSLANAFNLMTDNLKRQEKLRKQFTADIAHELRTPLTSIRSYIEAFQDGVLPADAENLASIDEEINRLVGLVSDLKDLNIAEMGALSASLHPLNLVTLLDKVIHNLSVMINDKGIGINYIHQELSVEILGDEHLLTRLFYNLIHNCYKYTTTGGTITVRLDDFADKVQVSIRDTGIGISEADLPLIFERFYRTDRSRARETGGSGIGLALVKQIAVLHQGNISVESKVGEGSLFMVTLPKKLKQNKSLG